MSDNEDGTKMPAAVAATVGDDEMMDAKPAAVPTAITNNAAKGGEENEMNVKQPAVVTEPLQPQLVDEAPMMMEQPAVPPGDEGRDAGGFMMAPIAEDDDEARASENFVVQDARLPARQPGLMKDPPLEPSQATADDQPMLKSPPTETPSPVDAANPLPPATDEEAGQKPTPPPGATSSTEVPSGAAKKVAAADPNEAEEGEDGPKKSDSKKEINPNFKDVQSTGKWGSITKVEMIIVGVVSLAIVIGVIVAVVVLVVDQDANEEIVPAFTQAPTPMATPIPADERFPVLLSALERSNVTASLLEERYSNDPANYEGLVGPGGSCSSLPHVCAMSWVLYEDDFPPANNDIVDRFAMATFYYALGGSDWKNNTNWLSPESYCDWYGIKCNRAETEIEEIDLVDNNLAGEIPLELSLADTIVVVSLKVNAIEGGLPGAVFGGLPKLFVLYVQDNLLTGTIPENLRDSESLAVLFLQGNNFTGPYPSVYCEGPEGSVFGEEFGLNCDANPCPEGCCKSINCH